MDLKVRPGLSAGHLTAGTADARRSRKNSTRGLPVAPAARKLFARPRDIAAIVPSICLRVPTRRRGRPVEHSFRLALAGGLSVRGLCGFGWVASLGSKSCHDRTMLEDHSLIRQYDCTEVWSCKRDWRVVHR